MGKLIRDKIKDKIISKGENPQTHVASETEYWEKLREKLNEEVKEFLESENEEELADILEVVNSICDFKGIDKKKLLEIKRKKKEENGGFKERIILDGTE